MLEAGVSDADILREYPDLELADIKACIAYAAELLRTNFVDLPRAS